MLTTDNWGVVCTSGELVRVNMGELTQPFQGGGQSGAKKNARQTVADVGKTPKNRGNHEYGRLAPVVPTSGQTNAQGTCGPLMDWHQSQSEDAHARVPGTLVEEMACGGVRARTEAASLYAGRHPGMEMSVACMGMHKA